MRTPIPTHNPGPRRRGAALTARRPKHPPRPHPSTRTAKTTHPYNNGNALTYDANGNTLFDEQGHTLVWDAWNRLAAVVDTTGSQLALYAYDAAGRRITEAPADANASEIYFAGTQDVEERLHGGSLFLNVQYVSHAYHAVAGGPASGDLNRDGYVDQADLEIWFANDGNTGSTFTWQVTERLAYNANGAFTTTVKDQSGTWHADWADYLDWKITFQGGRYNALTRMVRFGTSHGRELNVDTRRWITVDSGGYLDGLNLYWAFAGNPINRRDPSGLQFQGNETYYEQQIANQQYELSHPSPPPEPPEITKTGCNKISEKVGGSFYDLVGGGLSLEIAGEKGTFSNGKPWIDVGVSFTVQIGLGIGGELNLLGEKFTAPAELKGPQLGGKIEAHYQTDSTGAGALHVDRKIFLDLSLEGSAGEGVGLSDKIGVVLAIEYGVEADKTGMDGYISFTYEVTNEFTVSLGPFAYTKPVHFAEGGPTFKTPRISW